MLKDSAIRTDRGNVEPIFYIFPVDSLITVSCDHDHALRLSVSHEGRRKRLNAIFVERRKLLLTARRQILCNNLVDLF